MHGKDLSSSGFSIPNYRRDFFSIIQGWIDEREDILIKLISRLRLIEKI